jgi:PBP1b-binding outer membrane lipoprotein LpoB
MKKIPILRLSAYIVQGCVLETDTAKTGSNAQNATRGSMKSVQVQTIGKCCFDFSATLNKYSARLP